MPEWITALATAFVIACVLSLISTIYMAAQLAQTSGMSIGVQFKKIPAI